jgi:hypothetical protein
MTARSDSQRALARGFSLFRVPHVSHRPLPRHAGPSWTLYAGASPFERTAGENSPRTIVRPFSGAQDEVVHVPLQVEGTAWGQDDTRDGSPLQDCDDVRLPNRPDRRARQTCTGFLRLFCCSCQTMYTLMRANLPRTFGHLLTQSAPLNRPPTL